MKIDERLNKIDDCLYRVATKAIITNNNKVLLVKEIPEKWWGFPGGGVDHGETFETSLIRELKEELGVNDDAVSTDFDVAHITIGGVVEGVPRVNVFYKVYIQGSVIRKTKEVDEWGWFTQKEFIDLNMSPSYADRSKLADIIW